MGFFNLSLTSALSLADVLAANTALDAVVFSALAAEYTGGTPDKITAAELPTVTADAVNAIIIENRVCIQMETLTFELSNDVANPLAIFGLVGEKGGSVVAWHNFANPQVLQFKGDGIVVTPLLPIN